MTTVFYEGRNQHVARTVASRLMVQRPRGMVPVVLEKPSDHPHRPAYQDAGYEPQQEYVTDQLPEFSDAPLHDRHDIGIGIGCGAGVRRPVQEERETDIAIGLTR